MIIEFMIQIVLSEVFSISAEDQDNLIRIPISVIY